MALARKILVWTVVAGVFGTLAWRQHRLVDHYAVNLMIWDQWAFYTPLFNGGGWWQTFDRQHGPHRQGFAFLITRELANWSDWNSRWDAFACSFAVMGAALLGMGVALRCGVKAGLSLATIPIIFFNIHQIETFVGPANLSHGAVPVLMFMLYCLAWFVAHRGARLTLISLLTFLLIFTGFGIFIGLITPVLLMVEAHHAIRRGERRHAWAVAAAFGSVLLSWLLFVHGYVPDPGAGYRFPFKRPLDYFTFVALMLANFFGIRTQAISAAQASPNPGAIIFGLAVAAMLLGLCVVHGLKILRMGVENNRRDAVIFSLAAFALIYCANAAVGRVDLGLVEGPASIAAPLASRYVTLMIPAGLAIFLQIATLQNRRLAGLMMVFYFLLLARGTVAMTFNDEIVARYYHDGREQWKTTYLATRQETRAFDVSHFPVNVAPDFHDRLKFLEVHHFNLFDPGSLP